MSLLIGGALSTRQPRRNSLVKAEAVSMDVVRNPATATESCNDPAIVAMYEKTRQDALHAVTATITRETQRLRKNGSPVCAIACLTIS